MQSPLQWGPLTLTLWVRIHSWRSKLDITLYDKVYRQLAAGQWFSPVSSTNKTDRHDMSDVLLKMALNTINRTQKRLHERTFLKNQEWKCNYIFHVPHCIMKICLRVGSSTVLSKYKICCDKQQRNNSSLSGVPPIYIAKWKL